MLKRIEEDWSFFNQAVREKAEGKPRQEVPPLKLVTPAPPPAPSKPAPPAPPPPVQPPSATAAAPTSPSRPRPLNVGWGTVPRLLFGIIAVAMLIALIEAPPPGARPINPAATGTEPGAVANGRVGTGGTERVVTDYTTFNTVVYRSWKVVTGWRFADSRATQPNHQYCYLEVLTTGGQQMYDVEERAPVRRHAMPEALIPGLDKAAWDEAATRCVWHH